MKLAFTITSNNYLAFTSILVKSFLRFNNDYSIYIFTIDDGHDLNSFATNGNVVVKNVHQLGFEEIKLTRNKYNDFEFCNSLKPFLAKYLIDTFSNILCVTYLDSDLKFYNKIDYAEQLLNDYDIILTPHILTPVPVDGFLVNEMNILNTGMFNAGFFMLKPGVIVSDFLKWWIERVNEFCYVDMANGMFVDQIWLNFVPFYFDKVCILKHSGYNLAHWNLHERKITIKNDNYVVNDIDNLIFFHFSGYDLNNDKSISKYTTRHSLNQRLDLISIFRDYKLELQNNSKSWSLASIEKPSNLNLRLRKRFKYFRFLFDIIKNIVGK